MVFYIELVLRNCFYSISCLFLIGKPVGEGKVLSGLGQCPDYEDNTNQNERYAEHLTEVHAVSGNHFVFRLHLYVLYIFYKEARQENSYEEHTGNEPRALFCVLFPIHPHQKTEKSEIAECFIYLCRMSRKRLSVA